jgi:hypothetical protein
MKDNNILEIDNMCGVQGKRQTIKTKEEKKETAKILRLEVINPLKDETKFKSYFKNITKLMKDFFEIDNFKPDIDQNMWFLVFSKRTVIAMGKLNDENILEHFAISKTYKRKAIGKEAVQQIVKGVYNLRKVNPILKIDNIKSKSKSIIDIYESFDFKIKRIDEKFTYMNYVGN